MAKNNYFINQARRTYLDAQNMIPAVYASIAIALHDRGRGYKRINDLFCDSQQTWEDHSGNITDMIKRCEKETGIELRGSK